MPSTLKRSRTAPALAARILAILDTGARPLPFFRSFAANDAQFEQAVGRLFILGQVTFRGSKRGRVLCRA